MRSCYLFGAVIFCTAFAGHLPAQPPAAGAGDATVIGNVEHLGWGLVGSRGRHYMFGGIAMADYSDSAGQRRIVALQREDQIEDAKHLYYRELRDGHRWAIAREPSSREPTAGRIYAVWFQLAPTKAGEKPTWLPFHRARLEEQRPASMSASTVIGVPIAGGQIAGEPCLP